MLEMGLTIIDILKENSHPKTILLEELKNQKGFEKIKEADFEKCLTVLVKGGEIGVRASITDKYFVYYLKFYEQDYINSLINVKLQDMIDNLHDELEVDKDDIRLHIYNVIHAKLNN